MSFITPARQLSFADGTNIDKTLFTTCVTFGNLRAKEEELAAIRRRQEAFTRQRNAEMAEVQRMEAEAKRKSAEK